MEKKNTKAAGRQKKRNLKGHETEVLEYFRQEKSIEEIAEMTGFAKTTLYGFFRENGLGKGKRMKEENLTYVAPRKIQDKVMVADGKMYRDVTEQYAGW